MWKSTAQPTSTASRFRHLHALNNAVTVVDLEPNADPPSVLAIGPDRGWNLLEVIWLELADDAQLAIHAMPLRSTFYDLLSFPG